MEVCLENACRTCLSSEVMEMCFLTEYLDCDCTLGDILHKCCDIEV